MSTAEAHPWQVTNDGKDPSRPEGERDVHGHYLVDASEIPMIPQGNYNTCIAHGMATIMWLMIMKKHGPSLTPCKQVVLTTIMAACDGYRSRAFRVFLQNVQTHLDELNSHKVYFPVPGDRFIAVSVKVHKVNDFNVVVQLLKSQPVLVEINTGKSCSHIACAFSAQGEGEGKYLYAYQSFKDKEIVEVRQDSQKNHDQFMVGFRVEVTILGLFDFDMIKVKDHGHDAVRATGKRGREDDQ